jgi:hypothetical protein
MKYTYDRLLNDDELRPHLELGDSLVFIGTAKAWQQIERQVDRLGFGDDYAVSRTSKAGLTDEQHVTRVSPVRSRPAG